MKESRRGEISFQKNIPCFVMGEKKETGLKPVSTYAPCVRPVMVILPHQHHLIRLRELTGF